MKYLILLAVIATQFAHSGCELVILNQANKPLPFITYQAPVRYKLEKNAMAQHNNLIAISNANSREILILEITHTPEEGIQIKNRSQLKIPEGISTSSPVIQFNTELNQLVYASGAVHHISVVKYNLATGGIISTKNVETGPDQMTLARAISPDLNTLIVVQPNTSSDLNTAALFPRPTVVYLNDAKINQQLPIPTLAPMLFDYMTFSPDSQYLTGIQSGAGLRSPHHKLITWDLKRLLEITALFSSPDVIRTPNYSPDGKFLMVGDLYRQQIRFWDTQNFFKEKGGRGAYKGKNNDGGFMHPVLSPQRDLLVFEAGQNSFGGDANTTIYIYKMDPEKMRTIGKPIRFTMPELINSITFTSDGRFLVLLNDKGVLIVIDREGLGT
jgi:WD40 repeat protein